MTDLFVWNIVLLPVLEHVAKQAAHNYERSEHSFINC